MKPFDLVTVDKIDDSPEFSVDIFTDQRLLAEIARSNEPEEVRKSAISKINDFAILDEVAATVQDEDIKYFVMRQKKYLELQLAATSKDKPKVTEQSVLEEVAINARDKKVRKAAIEKIKSEDVLARMALYDEDIEVRNAAVWEVTDQFILKEIIRNSKDFPIRKIALRKINDDNLMAEIARFDPDSNLRLCAIRLPFTPACPMQKG